MTKIRRNFLSGTMNQDMDERALSEGQYRSALNVDIIHSNGEDSGSVKNKKGTTLKCDLSVVSGIQSISNARTIGAVTDPSSGLIYWLVSSDEFDGIFEYNEQNGNCSRVIQSSKPSPSTPSQLNFSKDYYVTGINFLDGFLYWTDNLNEPRRIKIDRCKSYLVDDSRIDEDIRVIFSAPLRSPSITLVNVPGQENNLEDKFVQFAYRFKNKDNQYSAMSPFSATAFEADEYEIDFGAGENKAMRNRFNAVDVHFETGGSFVTEVQLLFRDTKSLNVSIVETFNKNDLGIGNDSIYTHRFSNNKHFSALESNQVSRLFDNVPLKAKAQEIVGRRVMYANYTQFYDISRANGTKINVDYQVGFVSKDLEENLSPERTFRSDRDYEVALIYGDSDGRFSTGITSETNTVHIPLSKSVKANSITVDINSDPPAFATQYRIVIKQSKRNYYNMFPILYYADGPFRYFLINGSDIDKFRVGEYVIFKSDVEGPILIKESYKVLEIEAKGSNFLSNGSTQIAGVYFKIKVENSSDFNPNALFTFSGLSYGTNHINPNGTGASSPPVRFRHSVAEKAIHYGDGDPLGMAVVGNNQYNYIRDFRVTIEVTPGNTFRHTVDLSASSGWTSGIPITGSPQWIVLNSTNAFLIQFNTSFNLIEGDQWKVNCRAATHLQTNIFGGVGIPLEGTVIAPGDWGGGALLPGEGWSPTSSPETDRAIEAGAIVKIQIEQDSENVAQQAGVQQFPPSPRRYENIEEWFIESGAYQSFSQPDISGTDIGAEGITFRRGSYWQNITNGNFSSDEIYQGQVQITGTPPNLIINDLGITPEALNYPVHMIIQGFGFSGNAINVIKASFEIQQTENLAQCETKAIETDVPIYYETLRTFPISNGKHRVLWRYQDFTFDFVNFNTVLGQLVPGDPDTEGLIPHHFNVGDKVRVKSLNINGVFDITEVPDRYNIIIDLPFPGAGPAIAGTVEVYHPDHEQRDQNPVMPASIRLGNPLSDNSDFNAFTFGNGIESDRVLDDFNETVIDYSPRSTLSIDIYEEERKESSITYSGLYREESSLNRLNEFNLSLSNFKNLETEFGSIQKLHSRDTDLIVLQESKVSRVLAGKNLLSDSVGGGSVTSVPEVLGTQISYVGEWGISSNPESFATWGDDIWFTDGRRGAVVTINGESIYNISSIGMTSYFRDLFKDSPNTQKLGVYNPRTHRYIIGSNDNPSVACQLSLTALESSFPGNTSGDITQIPDQDKETFGVISNTDWTTSIVYSTGSGWVTGIPASGFGDQEFFLTLAPNNTSQPRTATITFTFCNGLTIDHVVTQASGSEEVIILIVDDNG